jgi:hypothetical protein
VHLLGSDTDEFSNKDTGMSAEGEEGRLRIKEYTFSLGTHIRESFAAAARPGPPCLDSGSYAHTMVNTTATFVVTQ